MGSRARKDGSSAWRLGYRGRSGACLLLVDDGDLATRGRMSLRMLKAATISSGEALLRVVEDDEGRNWMMAGISSL